jgi:hypothetical protein
MTAYCDTCGTEARHQVCESCYNGNHKHMKPERVEKILESRSLEFIDGVDCKNSVPDGQCICPEFIKLKHEILYNKWKKVKG